MLKRDFITKYIHIKYTKYLFPKFRTKLLNFYAYKKNFDWTRYYKKVEFNEAINNKKKSDTIFIFGSGWSVNNINKSQWDKMSNHNTLSFNWFIYQSFIRIDYHLVRGTFYYVRKLSDALSVNRLYSDLISSNKFYNDTNLFIQEGKTALAGNLILGVKMLPKRYSICRFKTKSKGIYEIPSNNFNNGLVHGPSTLVDTINLAILGGWKKIVLVGVDLYNTSYFWLKKNNSGHYANEEKKNHSTVYNGVIEYLTRWNKQVRKEKKEIFVLNKDSLLAKNLKVFKL
tara:strand:+ start:258 stop:1112 length:855 start_codon:yes stop_codon:yes gene_type:complete